MPEETEMKNAETKDTATGKKKRKLSMPKIILISAIFAVAVTLLWFVIEGSMVKKTGHMPFERVQSGGECIEYMGIFWGRTILTPMTSIDEPVVAQPDIIGYRRPMVFWAIGILFACCWTILTLLTGRWKVILIIFGSAGILFLLVTGIKKAKQAWDETPMSISNVRVYTTDVRSGECVSVDYPWNSVSFVKAREEGPYGKYKTTHLSQMIKPEDVTKEQFKALLKAGQTVKENSNRNWREDFTYRVEIVYKTRTGYGEIRVNGYGGTYPEGWADLVAIVNELAGGEYLRPDPGTFDLTPEWFTENFGVTDEDLPGALTVEDYLNNHDFRRELFSGLSSSGTTYPYDAEKGLQAYLSRFEEETGTNGQ